MMTDIPPIKFQWDGEALVPSSGFWRREADHYLVVGQTYRMVEEQERSPASHRHEFAFVKEAWNSLPEHLEADYPSPEHLRKTALIRTGFCTMVQHPCATKAEADRLRATLGAYVDKYAIVQIDEERPNVVTVLTAESQSHHAMDRKRFQASKTAIMEFIGDMLGVDPAALASVGEAA